MIDGSFLQEYFPLFFKGLCLSLQIAFFSSLIGIVLGVLFGFVLTLRTKFLYRFVWLYVVIIRGTPMLIQITATYLFLKLAGIPISAYWSSIISIGLNSAAYMSQVMMSGINSVGKGQIEAAKTLGFSQRQTMTLIVLPQAIKTVLPSLGNEFITLVKDSSLASTIGVCELTKQGSIVISQTYDVPAVYLTIGLMYLTITTIISFVISKLEKKSAYHVKS